MKMYRVEWEFDESQWIYTKCVFTDPSTIEDHISNGMIHGDGQHCTESDIQFFENVWVEDDTDEQYEDWVKSYVHRTILIIALDVI